MRPPHTPTRRRRGPARVTAPPRGGSHLPTRRVYLPQTRRTARGSVSHGYTLCADPQTPQIRGCLGSPKGIARQDYPAMNGVGTQAWALAAPRWLPKGRPGRHRQSAPRAQLGLDRLSTGSWPGLGRVLADSGQRRCGRSVPARTARGGLRQPASPGRAEGDVDASATRCRRRSMPQYQDANEAAGSLKGPPPTNARGLISSHSSETARRHDPYLGPVAEVQRRSGKRR